MISVLTFVMVTAHLMSFTSAFPPEVAALLPTAAPTFALPPTLT